jgi:hypothetical protein
MTKDYLRVYEEAIAEVKRNRESRAKLSAASQGGAK